MTSWLSERSRPFMRTWTGVILVLMMPVWAWGQPPTTEAVLPAVYRLQVGDQLEIKLFYNSDLNETVTVRPDGCLSLQLVGEVRAAGKTPAELAADLRTGYREHLRDPEVVVIVRSFPAPQLYVDGEIGRPGIVGIHGQMTLLQALAAAGGLKRSARMSEVLIVRADPLTGRQIIKTDLRQVLRDSDAVPDPMVRPFDIVLVPRSRIANVNNWVDQYIRQNLPITLTFGIFASPF
ncbi:MAG: polysaccharide biosynthesis/export family protein [Vicinamibacterales bacterium]